MKEYFTKNEIEDARKLDLLTYLKNFEPEELVRVGVNTYSTRTHDSVRISNGMWNRFSTKTGGKSALDYLTKVEGLDFKSAMNRIMDCLNVTPTFDKPQTYVKKEYDHIVVPQKAQNNDKVIAYLKSRGIDEDIIKYCIDNKLVYQENKTNNVVFLGYDENNSIKYASLRATNDKRIMREAQGSSKEYSFRITNKDSSVVHLFESAIDMLSFATLTKKDFSEWKNQSLISLGGVYQARGKDEIRMPKALDNFLKNSPNVKTIMLHFDNDVVGRNATKYMKSLLESKYEVINKPAPCGKDINDYLCYKLNLKKFSEIEKFKHPPKYQEAR